LPIAELIRLIDSLRASFKYSGSSRPIINSPSGNIYIAAAAAAAQIDPSACGADVHRI